MESFPFYKSWNHDAPELYFASKCCINYPAGDFFFITFVMCILHRKCIFFSSSDVQIEIAGDE